MYFSPVCRAFTSPSSFFLFLLVFPLTINSEYHEWWLCVLLVWHLRAAVHDVSGTNMYERTSFSLYALLLSSQVLSFLLLRCCSFSDSHLFFFSLSHNLPALPFTRFMLAQLSLVHTGRPSVDIMFFICEFHRCAGRDVHRTGACVCTFDFP